MTNEERDQFADKFGFDPGVCRCEECEEEGDFVEMTACHAELLDKFVLHAEAQHQYIKAQEQRIAELEMITSLSEGKETLH